MLRKRRAKQDSILPLTNQPLHSPSSTGAFSNIHGGNPYRNGQNGSSSFAKKLLTITISIFCLLLFIYWIYPSERSMETDRRYESKSSSKKSFAQIRMERMEEERLAAQKRRDEKQRQYMEEMHRIDAMQRQREKEERDRKMIQAHQENIERERKKFENKHAKNYNGDRMVVNNKNKINNDRRPADGSKMMNTDGGTQFVSPTSSPSKTPTAKPIASIANEDPHIMSLKDEDNNTKLESSPSSSPLSSLIQNSTELKSNVTTAILEQKNTTTVFSTLCPDNKTQAILNDDYCDCPDGSDEPNTSACSYILVQKSTFVCADGINQVHSSRVNDGIQDCSDGSDETRRN